MRDKTRPKSEFRTLYNYTVAALTLWTIVIAGSLTWDIYNEKNAIKKLARNEARSVFNPGHRG